MMCWADNAVGQQKEPCVFHIIAAGKPDMPYNCTLVNQTSESLEVDCAEGMYIVLEIFFFVVVVEHVLHINNKRISIFFLKSNIMEGKCSLFILCQFSFNMTLIKLSMVFKFYLTQKCI